MDACRTHPKFDGTSEVGGALNKTGATGSPRSPPPFIPMEELGRRRVLLNIAVSIAFLGLMHGTHAIFPVAFVCAAFMVGHALRGTRLAQPVTWVMAVGLIWLKERWFRVFTFETLLGAGFAWLDQYQGMHPWRLSFNLAVLRIVSFNIDLHWAELQSVQGSGASALTSNAHEKVCTCMHKRHKKHDLRGAKTENDFDVFRSHRGVFRRITKSSHLVVDNGCFRALGVCSEWPRVLKDGEACLPGKWASVSRLRTRPQNVPW